MCLLGVVSIDSIAWAQAIGPFRAGVYAKNIDPKSLPVWVNGNIAGVQADRIHDSLHARCLVMSDGRSEIAICIVDSCLLPIELTEKARQMISESTGIRPDHILIAATHTHSAVSVAGAHGTPVQEDYAKELPGWIAEGVQEAKRRMVSARWGKTSVVCDKFVYCRRWMMKPGSLPPTPFTGRDEDQVQMNPGYDNPNRLYQVGPIDRLIPVLSIQTIDGKPLSVLASFSTHYAGAPALSADYFAVFCNQLAKSLRPDDPDQFMGLMTNATSGDANCVDFSQPAMPFTPLEVGQYVADKILSVLPLVEYQERADIDVAMTSLEIDVRMPTDKEVVEAKKYMETHFPDRLPISLVENYARETVLLSEMPPTRSMNLQVLRIGDMAIVANPCESYGETGLKLRQASPFSLTMNIGLANGHAGYIPPPEHFVLGGYTTWRARSSCLEEQAEPKMVQGLTELMKLLDARRKSAVTEAVSMKGTQAVSKRGPKTPPQSPIDPKESVQWMETEAGYRIELVACEPQVVDPVAMQIDGEGRMWVVEMRDYPNGPSRTVTNKEPEGNSTSDAAEEALGRIVVLEDKNRDGFFETSTTFADHILFGTGIQLWKDGAIVTAAGELLFLRDRDGDLRADEREVWLSGFAAENPQLRANHPTIAPDGRLYIANGLRGGKVNQPRREVQWKWNTGEPNQILDLGGNDLRIDLIGGRAEAITGPSQFGLTFDRWGRRYGCANRQPCLEAIVEQDQLSQSPLAGLAPAIGDVSPSEALSSVRPLVHAWTTSNLHAGQFTAACGVLVSHSSQLLGGGYGHVLTCEPTGSLVQRRLLERVNGRTTVSDSAPEQEWLASHDSWFRPVNLYEGPSGALYVVDMYRAVIEHPEWVPQELKNRADERYGDRHGRIYRVVRQDAKPVEMRSIPRDRWLPQLLSTYAWNRDFAVRKILEDPTEEAIQYLKTECQLSKLPEVRVIAASLLHRFNRIESSDLDHLFGHSDVHVRSHGWRMLAEIDQSWALKYLEQAIKALESDDADEVQNAAWYLAIATKRGGRLSHEWEDRKFQRAVEALVRQADSGYAWMSIAAACSQDPSRLLHGLFERVCTPSEASNSKWAEESIAWKAIARLSSQVTTDSPRLNALRDRMTEILREPPSNSASLRFALSMLESWLPKGVVKWDELDLEVRNRIQKYALQEEHHPSIGQDIRTRSLRLMRFADRSIVETSVTPLLEHVDQDVVLAAMEACSVLESEDFDSWLVEQLGKGTNRLRAEAFSILRSDLRRLEFLMANLEAENISLRILDAAQRQSLQSTADEGLRGRATKLFESLVNKDRQKILDEYAMALNDPADAGRGREVFVKNCSTCHRIDDDGYAVGPDISDARDQTLEKLLVAILDPNRSVDANYFRYVALTEDGQVVEGLLRDANGETIVLKGQNAKETVLRRDEISELKAIGTSLMPEGVESQITVREMADLLSYIKNWRYLDGRVHSIPLTP